MLEVGNKKGYFGWVGKWGVDRDRAQGKTLGAGMFYVSTWGMVKYYVHT